jgi:hypothetical protein
VNFLKSSDIKNIAILIKGTNFRLHWIGLDNLNGNYLFNKENSRNPTNFQYNNNKLKKKKN